VFFQQIVLRIEDETIYFVLETHPVKPEVI
jgi:hypothetical protein